MSTLRHWLGFSHKSSQVLPLHKSIAFSIARRDPENKSIEILFKYKLLSILMILILESITKIFLVNIKFFFFLISPLSHPHSCLNIPHRIKKTQNCGWKDGSKHDTTPHWWHLGTTGSMFISFSLRMFYIQFYFSIYNWFRKVIWWKKGSVKITGKLTLRLYLHSVYLLA